MRAIDKKNDRECEVRVIDFEKKQVKLHYDNKSDWIVTREVHDYYLSLDMVDIK